MLSRYLVELCIVLVVSLTMIQADDAACAKQMQGCVPPALKNMTSGLAGLKNPMAILNILCRPEVIQAIEQAYTCVWNSAGGEPCTSTSPALRIQLQLFRTIGKLDVGRIDDGMQYLCQHKSVFPQLAECEKSPDVQKMMKCQQAAQTLAQQAVKEGEGLTQATVCGVVDAQLQCFNTQNFPKCYESDLSVVKTSMSKILPQGCVSCASTSQYTIVFVVMAAVLSLVKNWSY